MSHLIDYNEVVFRYAIEEHEIKLRQMMDGKMSFKDSLFTPCEAKRLKRLGIMYLDFSSRNNGVSDRAKQVLEETKK